MVDCHILKTLTVSACLLCLTSCVQAVPPDLIVAIEAIDRDLIALHAPETAPQEYARFAEQWVSLKSRVQLDDDLIRWPWESSNLEDELRRLYDSGERTVSRLHVRQEAEQQTAQSKLLRLEERLHMVKSRVESIDGRITLGEQAVKTDLLVKQARAFFEQKDYQRAIQAAEKAHHALLTQTAVLTRELGRYADDKRIASWRSMASQTIEWSHIHHSTAIVVSKADRELTLYKDGRKVLSYPVRLGFNGLRAKEFQGDGATPEGRYRVIAKRGQGETQFFRALVLDYPNAEDRRRFELAKRAGTVEAAKGIGGQIEIHGSDNELLAQTLGCVMLDNQRMAALYEHVSPNTPVTIVGALTEQNSIALALSELGGRNREI
jgi:L,D-peptidoglycan transpeptidase YkuD (ErfK/YbiS/YcfS/YnhG family)